MNLNGNNKDLILQSMEKHGIPVTLDNYLGLAYPDGFPEDYGHDHHMQLPEEIRQMIDNNDS